jgi:hypothetical protein
MKKKPGPKKKYKTAAERKAAQREYSRKYREANREKIRAAARIYYRKQGKPARGEFNIKFAKIADCISELKAEIANLKKPSDSTSQFENRLAALEKENKDILKDLEEVLQDNRKLQDEMKWGKKNE